MVENHESERSVMDFKDILDRWEALEKAKREGAGTRRGGKDGERPASGGKKANAPSLEKSLKARHPEGMNPEKMNPEGMNPERNRAQGEGDAHSTLEAWLAGHGVEDKDSGAEREKEDQGGSVSGREMSMRAPQARLDLHGLSSADAEKAVFDFLAQCSRRGLENVLIVHGKGNHSAEGPILAGVVRKVLESSPLAGSHGTAHRSLGGRGATWVRIRKAGYFSR